MDGEEIDLAARRKHSSIAFVEECDKRNNIVEMQIPVPYGTIAGKWYGPSDVRPVLCLHGWLDNCGSFDRLIPLLPTDRSYLAIDLPGHGRTTRIPAGTTYSMIDYMSLVMYILRYYKWNKVSLLAHSMAANVAFAFTALFPQLVDLLICLDELDPLSYGIDRVTAVVSISIDKIVDIHLRATGKEIAAEPPAYDYEDMIEKQYHATAGSLTREVSPHILQRMISPSKRHEGKYFFNGDSRIRYLTIPGWSNTIYFKLAERINVPFLAIKATESPYRKSKERFDEMVALQRKINPKFEVAYVAGNHHAHLTQPELVEPIICDFLKRYNINPDRSIASKL
ncbi:probable serine hydrolase [Anopheles ziemanni]|uniref:probable serine hydrolase n=2 Tax=coustani group TaxID=59130 RepID=UPI00265E3A46|nr:probable serine hydrolase [Anopheles ziemanni]